MIYTLITFLFLAIYVSPLFANKVEPKLDNGISASSTCKEIMWEFTSRAQTYLDKKFERYEELLSQVSPNNETKIANSIDVAKLEQETALYRLILQLMKDAKWTDNQGNPIKGSGGTRYGGVHYPEKSEIVLNEHELGEEFGMILTDDCFCLHEAVSAIGYEDENYSFSSLLFLWSFSQSEEHFNLLTPYLREGPVHEGKLKRYQMAGGGTSVGGGGDPAVTEIKQILIWMSLQQSPSIIRKISELEVVICWDNREDSGCENKSFEIQSKNKDNYSLKLSLKYYEKDKRKVIDEIYNQLILIIGNLNK